MNIHGKMELTLDSFQIISCKLISHANALSMPVCPVYLILKHGDSEWVGKPCRKDTTTHVIMIIEVCNTTGMHMWKI